VIASGLDQVGEMCVSALGQPRIAFVGVDGFALW
jgi:hypothetical protein